MTISYAVSTDPDSDPYNARMNHIGIQDSEYQVK